MGDGKLKGASGPRENTNHPHGVLLQNLQHHIDDAGDQCKDFYGLNDTLHTL